MDTQKGRFDFCPKCGAVTRDGKCQSCGYHMGADAVVENQQPTEAVEPVESQQSTQSVEPVESQQSVESVENQQPVEAVETQKPVRSVEPSPYESTAQSDQAQDLTSTEQGMIQNGVYSNNGTTQQPFPQRSFSQQNSGNMMQQGMDYRTYSEQQYQRNGYQNNQQYQSTPNQQYQNTASQQYQNTSSQQYQSTPNQQYQNTSYQQYQNIPNQQYPGNNYQNNQQYQQYQTPQKQNTGLIVALAIVGTILVLGIIVIIVASFLVVRTVEHSSTGVAHDYTYGDSNGTDSADPFSGEEDRGQEEPFIPQQSTGEDPFLDDGYVNSWGTDHQNHDKSEFTGEYYENIQECIDDSTDYKIKRDYYEYFSEKGNVAIRVAYYQLEGDIPNLEELNNDIMMYSAYMAGNYFDSYGEGDYDGIMELNADSYVTFNDDKVMSIVLDERWNIDGGSGFDLYGINVDLQNGTIMKNDGILDMDEKFAEVFKTRNKAQNETDGEVAVVDDNSPEQLMEYLNDTTNSIIFYTPVGMEVGFNYSYNESSGWVTVTFKDYEKYLKSF